jgi:hypothetical protein
MCHDHVIRGDMVMYSATGAGAEVDEENDGVSM